MIIVKLISSNFKNWPIFRQTPNESGIWKDIKFVLEDSQEEYSHLVVYESFDNKIEIKCPKENIYLFTGEPPEIKKYDEKYIKQFTKIITCHELLNSGVVKYQQSLPWHVGRKQIDGEKDEFGKNYDELKNMPVIKKSKIISVITSNKVMTDGHKKRVEFVSKLKEHFGDKIDVFGRGINEISDKWDAISNYKYHIVLENSSYDDYWTEKLSDCLLGQAYPIYYGAKNLKKYFSEKVFTTIDINDINGSINKIEEVLRNELYEKNLEDILNARTDILDKYNLFPEIYEIIKKEEKSEKSNKRENQMKYLYPENTKTSLFFRLCKKIKKLIFVN